MDINKTNLYFNIETLHTIDGKSIRTITPDKDGVYRDVPLAILGKASRNRAFYDPTSFVNAMTNPNSAFFKSLTESCVEGEWGHPFYPKNDEAAIKRIMYIDRANLSHYFIKFTSKPTEDGSLILISGDVVPFGDHKQKLIDVFRDPRRNASFSLRSLTAPPMVRNNILYKKVLSLITFDAVSTGGYAEASKRFMVSNESMQFQMPAMQFMDNNDYKTAVGFESINNEQLFDMLDTDKIIVENKIIGHFDDVNNSIINPDGTIKSVFHSVYK